MNSDSNSLASNEFEHSRSSYVSPTAFHNTPNSDSYLSSSQEISTINRTKNSPNSRNQAKLESEVKRLTKENKSLKKQLRNSNNHDESEMSVRLIDLDNKLQSVSIERDEYASDVSKLQLENKNLKNKISNSKVTENDAKCSEIEEALSMIETLIVSQSDDISLLSQQRNDLFCLIQNLISANSELEVLLEDSLEKSSDFEKGMYDLESKLAEAQDLADREITEILNEFVKIDPDGITNQLNEFHNLSGKQQIIEIFKRTHFDKLFNPNLSQNHQNKSNYSSSNNFSTNFNYNSINNSNISNNDNKNLSSNFNINDLEVNELSKVLTKREEALLGHLENAIRFIRLSANSTHSNLNEEDRTYVMAQTSRIASFIEEQSGVDGIAEIASLFEMDSPETQLQTFFDFADETSIEKTPIKELYVLFKAALEVNSLMFSHLERIASDSRCLKEDLNSAREENVKIKSQYEELAERVDFMKDDLEAIYGEDNDVSPFDAVSDLIKILLKLQNENKEQKNIINRLGKKIVSERNKFAKRAKTMKGTTEAVELKHLQEENEQLIQKVNSFDQISSENQQLRNEVADALKKLKKLQDEYSEMKSIDAEARKHLEDELNKSQSKNTEISKLVDTLKEKQNQTETMSVILNDKDRKLKQKISKLKKMLENSENNRLFQISQMKQQSDSINQKYESRIEHISNELQETRQQLIDATETIHELEESKSTLQRNIAKFKLFEKTNEMKLKQHEEHLNSRLMSEKSQFESRIMLLQSQYASSLGEKDAKISKIRDSILNIIRDHFDDSFTAITNVYQSNSQLNSQNSNDQNKDSGKYIAGYFVGTGLTVEEAVTTLSECLKRWETPIIRQTIDEATQIRGICGMKASDSILNKFRELNDQLITKTSVCQQQESEITRLGEEVRKKCQELTKGAKIRQDLKSWEKWSVAMFRHISDESIPFIATADVRAALEEAIMASIGHRTLRRKIDLLRSEKKILQMRNIDSSIHSLISNSPKKRSSDSSRSPMRVSRDSSRSPRASAIQPSFGPSRASMRELLLISVFIKRLQSYSGCVSALGFQALCFSVKPTESRKTTSIIPLEEE
ncbi:hypothetical protein TRFO_28274 [Tritrichomonas foetus]|uniref:Uncharacterized protein n=1 Tax=Tritrichomonas foetus TaxID=1144522 RepID=A0A1J4K014_9EUKA|nr:hypothetical protein TRFO_28274 [Tritrichomonas foetus]|eukprot:OHT04282.1 hypothetical protein TRFO_28274 [Tritrichomonas foetus]